MSWLHLLVALLAFAATSAEAEANQCTDATGRLQFSDRPCGKNAKLLQSDSVNRSSAPANQAPVNGPYIKLDDGNTQK